MMRNLALCCVAAVVLSTQAPAQQVLPNINLNRGTFRAEEVEWANLRKSTDLERLRSFEARYPNGRYHGRVERRIAQLEAEARARGEAVNETLASSPESQLVVVDGFHGAVVRVLPK